MSESEHACVECKKTSNEIPLLRLEYQDKVYWICPQHLPLLIHKPWALIDKLPGAEKLGAGTQD